MAVKAETAAKKNHQKVADVNEKPHIEEAGS